jgi:leader peptidase (prepilin peptidase)/N-methyltransferase
MEGSIVLFIVLLGLVIGSFLNVVIYRVPIQLMNQWREDYNDLMGVSAPAPSTEFNIAQPSSHCPQCKHPLRFYENIPLVSFLAQKGRCRHCQTAISRRYPLIEILTAVLSIALYLHFGLTWQFGFSLIFTWSLLSASMIDIDHQLLPDVILLPLLWLGLIGNCFNVFTTPVNAILGAASAYMSLWLFAKLYALLTGKDGMGHGDMKLLAVFGAWMGYTVLPLILIISSCVGALVGITLLVMNRADRNTAMPFGPYLAAAGWIALLWGDTINAQYIHLF